MNVGDIMSVPVVTVGPDASLQDAIETMLEHRVGSVVVTETGPVGILTRSDVLRVVYRTGEPLAEGTVRAGMSGDLVTTTPETTVASALEQMREHGVKKLPAVADLDLVGIVTTTDVAHHQPQRVREVRASMERKDDWTG